MWICMNCGAKEECSYYPPECLCGIERSWNEVGSRRAAVMVRATDCNNKPFKRIQAETEDLNTMLDGGWPLGFSALVWGQPGGGKSRLTYRWASQTPPSLILLYENGPAPRCYILGRQLLEHAGGKTNGVHFSNDRDNWETYADRIRAKTIVCDSISVFPPTMQIEMLKRFAHYAAKNNAFVWAISHATKAGDAKGLNELQHEPDATLIVKRTPWNTAKVLVKKSRFCGPGFTELPIVGAPNYAEHKTMNELVVQPYKYDEG